MTQAASLTLLPMSATAGRPAGAASGLLIAGAVALLALPSAVLAFSSRLDGAADAAANQGLGAFAPGAIDPRLARALAARQPGSGPLFRFTPAGLATRPDRSVTVAVRVDSDATHEIIVRAASAPRSATGVVPLRITPAAYTLGVSRGYQGFVLSADPHRPDQPDLGAYHLTDSTPDPTPRLAPRIQLGQSERPGRAPRTLEAQGEQSVDVGGSYRLTRNLDVTAGVRYSQDRDRLKPLLDGKQDSQAVFVGTQFRF